MQGKGIKTGRDEEGILYELEKKSKKMTVEQKPK